MTEVTLALQGRLYSGWQQVHITRSLAQISGTFELRLTDKWALDRSQLQVQPGQAARVFIGDHPVITGWVDDIEARHSDEDHQLAVRGRDVTGDLVDCAAIHESQEWVGRDLAQVARDLARPFGVAVRAEVDVGPPFRYHHAHPGETVYELLERGARMRGVLLMSDGDGALVLTRAGAARSARRLVLGENILRGDAVKSHRDRYSLYRVLGQDRGDDFLLDETVAQIVAEVVDSGVTRYRPLVIHASEPMDGAAARERARWERSVRAGRGNEAHVSVRGWMDGDRPWRPNSLVAVRDPWLGLQGEYLLSAVVYRVDDEAGEVADLTLEPPGAYEVLAETETNPAGEEELWAWEGLLS